MITFNQWSEGQLSLFSAIQQHHEFEFITLLGVDKLDQYYNIQYGERELPKYLTNLSTMELANMVVIAYYSSWEKQYKLFSHEWELGVSLSETTNINTNDSTERDVTSGTTQKVSAFNDESMLDDNTSEEVVSDGTSKNVLTTSEKIVKDYTVLEKQSMLFSSSFILNIFKDILKYSSLSIY